MAMGPRSNLLGENRAKGMRCSTVQSVTCHEWAGVAGSRWLSSPSLSCGTTT